MEPTWCQGLSSINNSLTTCTSPCSKLVTYINWCNICYNNTATSLPILDTWTKIKNITLYHITRYYKITLYISNCIIWYQIWPICCSHVFNVFIFSFETGAKMCEVFHLFKVCQNCDPLNITRGLRDNKLCTLMLITHDYYITFDSLTNLWTNPLWDSTWGDCILVQEQGPYFLRSFKFV